MNTTNRLMWVTCVGLSLIVSVSSQTVTLLFDPPTPAPGIITISCQFELGAGDTLNTLYFNKISDARFFRYTVGSEPIIVDRFKDKVIDYKTDDATYMNLTFALSACDVAQYECNVLPSPSNADITDQKNLDVINAIPPVLKINGELPKGTVYVGVDVVVVTVELRNAGPPLPETLYLLQDGAAVATNSSSDQNTTTCTWDLPSSPLTLNVNVSAEDYPEDGRLYQCVVYYKDMRNVTDDNDPVLIMKDPCISDPCQNGGTCNSTIEGDKYSCKCPCGFTGDNCETYVCDPNPCLNNGICSVDTDCAAKCNCTDDVVGDTCDNGGDEDGGCTVVIIIVIVVCSLGCCCCIVVVVVYYVMKKKKKERRIDVAAVCCCVMKKKKQEQNCNHGNGVPLGDQVGVDNPGCQNSQHHYNGYEPQDEKTMPASQQPASIQRENSDSESSRKFKNRVTPDKE